MPRKRTGTGKVIGLLSVAILAFGACSRTVSDPVPAAQPAGHAPQTSLYDESADGEMQIAAAVKRAASKNKRVLLMFGANWCGWCHKLHDLFESDREVARILLYEYELVLIDIGRSDKHMDIAKRYGAELDKSGVPFLIVLDSAGQSVTTQETGSLEEGDHHSAEKVKTFLDAWIPAPQNAYRQFEAALKQATVQGKLVFLHFSAPWCGWCRELERFLAGAEVSAIMARDYVDLEIDVDRMAQGKEVESSFRPAESGGIPWLAVFDTEGKIQATSDGPDGNIGFPVEPNEIAHFIDMLTRTAEHNGAAEIGRIETLLEQNARRIKADST